MADIFLQLDNVEAETTEENYEKQIEVLSWSWGASNTSGFGTGTGGSIGGKPTYSDLTIMKNYDKATPTLLDMVNWTTHIPKGKLSLLKQGADGSKWAYLEIDLTDIVVTSVSTSGASSSQPTDAISFSFAKYELHYKVQDNEGNQTATADIGYDIVKGAKA